MVEMIIEMTTQYPVKILFWVAFLSLLTSIIHGATGIAGGLLLSVALAPIIGVKPIIPVVSFVLLFSHLTRILLNIKDFHRTAFLATFLPAFPCIILFAFLYGKMSSSMIAWVLAVIFLGSIPVRRWAQKHKSRPGLPMLCGSGIVYGAFSGVSIGAGMLLIPFLLGYGLTRKAFVATIAMVALMANITRLSVFGSINLFQPSFLLLSVIAGLMTIPGNWIGYHFLKKMTNEVHTNYVDILTGIGALNFIWIACQTL